MGYDATNYVPLSTPKAQIFELIHMLDFQGSGDTYHFFKEDDYKYLYGVLLNISKDDDYYLIHTRTPIYCSAHDLEYQNHVIRQIKRYCGGYFISDNGTNRYFTGKNTNTVPAQRGCHAAHFRLSNSFADILLLLNNHKADESCEKMMELYGVPSSEALLSNISTTYIASIIENYLRQLYVALLKYSDKKESIIASSKVNQYDLFEVSNNNICVEEAIALSKSFQNIHKAHSYFGEINKRIDIKGTLSKPYHGRKENLFLTIDRVLEHRHSLVHRMDVDIQYKIEEVKKDIKSVAVALDKIYEHICLVYGWEM